MLNVYKSLSFCRHFPDGGIGVSGLVLNSLATMVMAFTFSPEPEFRTKRDLFTFISYDPEGLCSTLDCEATMIIMS
jgi:hypothetical protein